MSTIRRLGIVLVTLIGCVACDQSTKYAAKQLLQGRDTISVMRDTLRVGYAENVGGFLGAGAALPEHARKAVFVVFASLAMISLLAYVIAKRELRRTTIVALALVASGGLGNIIDRITNDGAVIDFLNIGVGSVRTGIFNVADMAVVLGIALLFLLAGRARTGGGTQT